MNRPRTLYCCASLLWLLSSLCIAQENEAKGDADASKKKSSIKPYAEVITSEAKTDPGVFITHRIGDKLFFEIPTSALGKEFLWVTQIAKVQAGHGYGGTPVGDRVVRWELRGEQVLLRDVKFAIRADGGSVSQAVAATSLEPIISSIPVKAWGPDKAPVIDATDLFLNDLPEFSAKQRLGASGADRARAFVESVRSFPGNIETRVTMTYKPGSGDGPGRPGRRGGDSSQSGISVELHHSMVGLPETPMRPRRHDERVGFFTVGFEDYGSDEHEVERVRYITRWRLEKKDPKAAVSEPVKPIVFYVGRGVPERWRPFVRQGIEMWQPAFEAAGFKNAIIAKDAPSPTEDPEWDAEDARYSTIRWLPSTIENAMGPHVHDPRTGEILEADILVYHNVLKLCRDWYFVQASPCDERAQSLPMPDDLLGELLAYVIAHEVGHSLGFPHNMKASNSYSIEQLRSPEWTKKNGTEASIMDYGRFNYVAQPGDGAALIPTIGPYDFFAVQWGYTPWSATEEPEARRSLLARQLNEPMLRFGDPNPSEDPSQQTEDLGSDALAATELGLANIRRVASFLVKACCKPDGDYELLRNMYGELIAQRNRELGHVANLVGGMEKQNLYFGDADRVWHPVSRERQAEAVAFLNRHAFQTPKELIDPDVLWRLESNGAADRILNAQKSLLRQLVNDRRIKRMAEHAAMEPSSAYLPSELLDQIQNGVWSELTEPSVSVDLYRRNLQRAHVEILAAALESKDTASDLPALSRGQLTGLQGLLDRALKGAKFANDVSLQHVRSVRASIEKALDEKPAPKTPDF